MDWSVSCTLAEEQVEQERGAGQERPSAKRHRVEVRRRRHHWAGAFQNDPHIADKPLGAYMTRKPVNISSDKLATEVLAVLEKHPIDELVVINENGEPVGLVDTQDLTRMKLV